MSGDVGLTRLWMGTGGITRGTTVDPFELCSYSPDKAYAELKTSRKGLADEEAEARLAEFGENVLTAKKPVPMWRRFAAHLVNMFAILLWVGAVLSFLSDQAALGVGDHHRHPAQRRLRLRAGVPRREGHRGAQEHAAAQGQGHPRRPDAGDRGPAARSRRHHGRRGGRPHLGRRAAGLLGGPAGGQLGAHRRGRSGRPPSRHDVRRSAVHHRHRELHLHRLHGGARAGARDRVRDRHADRVRQDRRADAGGRGAALAAAEEHRAALEADLDDRGDARRVLLRARQAGRRDGDCSRRSSSRSASSSPTCPRGCCRRSRWRSRSPRSAWRSATCSSRSSRASRRSARPPSSAPTRPAR